MKHKLLTRVSIKWRIFIYLTGFCVLLLGLLWAFQILFLEQFYKAVKTLEIRRDAGAIGGYVSRNQWDMLVEAVSARDDLLVEAWDLDSGTIIVAGNYQDGIQSKMSYSDKVALFRALSEKGDSIIRPYFTENFVGFRRTTVESIMYSDVFVSENGTNCMIMVSATISPLAATIDTLRYQIYAITAAMLLISSIIAILLARRISKPIERLDKAAGELGRGNYNAQFEADGYREITQLAETLNHAASELSKTDALRRELIANVSHDLRTPLTLITGYSEMIRDLPGEATADNMQVIIDESKRLTALVSDLLDLSKLQSNTSEPVLAPISLTALIRRIIDRFAQFTERDDYCIEFEDGLDVRVLADENRLSQVIYNLITNAINYTGADKRVTVREEISGGRVRISVIDSGEGIAPEDLPHIWDRYYKVDKVHRRSAAGTGLGLSIVKNALSQHPGVDFGVESEPGKGSIFWFSMPIYKS
jgi:signal transduction histidine kinase